jgi:hypothetical protein
MITVGKFAEKKGNPRDTVYSWIYRNRHDKLAEVGARLIRMEQKGFAIEEIDPVKRETKELV